ncbi:phenazine biosynthesis-like domain-containing protein 1 [Amphibalanus amphitrite]|uniref:phenazine biosynthesis-like domain-containing protein 1 n=1 Tax=Amphibalanus amphitrite TaxID=1232801 RepID=UPI001C920BDB|nr:phenazine biosynthesis-like domain-containing protein 1 [Amphibalanus amphitrite]
MEGRSIEVFTVNAFTAEPFAGNPASVCLLEDPSAPDVLLQGIAAQMNHSETAFVTRLSEGDQFDTADTFRLRWFTPTTEVKLCGHGTMAAAAVLVKVVGNKQPQLTFVTRWELRLTAVRDEDRIELELPLNAPQPVPAQRFAQLAAAVCGQLPVAESQLSEETGKLLLRLEDSCTVRQLEELKPEVGQLPRLHDGSEVRGVIVTLKDGGKFDFQSRYFAPWVGIPEDPVTGSAHTVLAPYWARQLDSERLWARQCSARAGQLGLAVDWDRQRVLVYGEAVVVLQGKLRIP